MWSARLMCLPLLLVLFVTGNSAINVADDDDSDEYDVKARVARISLIEGEVTLKRKDSSDWVRPQVNFTLVEGDTVSTGLNGRLEIQLDARNFLRLDAGSVVRFATLRDEGLALSVIEGTTVLRLSKFDRARQFVEIDAPRVTLAVETDGLYRVDVSKQNHVRLTVRDGGSARVYSDTSAFALRSGRAAELIAEGADSGDWSLFAAPAGDDFEEWLAQREEYLTQRMHYDVQYYDEYVWGAEDLDSYGDWTYTSDYGWIWRPRASAISGYNDWVPYRYGYWSWVDPYGWTWVASEPWGWAPYHYGRWVFYNGYWAWCPRSFFYRRRSWWRPALVVFVSLDHNRNYCWYPLRYHQRDPHSRNYRPPRQPPDKEPPPRVPGAPSKTRGYLHAERIDPAQLKAVSGIPSKDLGRDVLRPFKPADPVAREVLELDPTQGRLDIPRPGSGVAGRPTRVMPSLPIPDRDTGATLRRPGVSLDDELRRGRVFDGRVVRPANPSGTKSGNGNEDEPREVIPPRSIPGDRREGDREIDRGQNRNANPGTNRNTDTAPGFRPSPPSATGNAEQPAASQPRENKPDDMVRPRDVDTGEKRSRDRHVRIEGSPRVTPTEPPNDTPASGNNAPPQNPPRRDERPTVSTDTPAPRATPRSEATPQPSDLTNSPRTEQRNDSPRRTPQPSPDRPIERPALRSEPRNEQRSEPRPEPRPESPPPRTETPRSEAPRPEPPKSQPPRAEAPRAEAPRSEAPRPQPPKSGAPRAEAPRAEAPRSEAPRPEPPKSEAPRSEQPRSETPRPDGPRKP